ncbi:MAG: NTP transferase domain-containing protein [Bacteroidia bacterium]|nr:NTP transferase domain-containing protein [Bacteroidia bacterium]
MKPTLLILAAGIGSRYGGLKQLDAIGPHGETIIDYSIFDAIRAGFGKVVFVINERIEKEFNEVIIKKLQPYIQIEYVFQEIWKVPEGVSWLRERTKPWGTGHALLMADGMIDTPFAVINADDFYGREAYQTLTDYYARWTPDRENDYAMVAFEIGKTLSEHGFVCRGVCQTDMGNYLEDVVERTWIERKPAGIVYKDNEENFIPLSDDTVVSMNFWGFTPSFFGYLQTGFREFLKANGENLKAEYYIPTAVNKLIQDKIATVRVLPCAAKWYGITYKEDKVMVVRGIRRLIEKDEYPEKLWS